ncbi:hypothetical protein [Flavobacterium aquiphilum]|uniref:hypothetical protein n=1 Tax=Flavobacterium aquiphilum TaxID=3003261 RepID=UPI0024818299|nr:hypothetical protein [Flavobacterium aquiphilum]
MKTIFSKRFMAPLVVMILGGAGAFVTTSMSSTKSLAPVPGFVKLDPNGDECEEHDECSTVNNGIICRVGYSPAGAQLYDKNSAGQCTVPVYRP